MIEMRWRISGPLSDVSGMPAMLAEPEVGAISVPRVRTVVVFPAPFGPRKPNTSPGATVNDTSWNAVRSPKRLGSRSPYKAGDSIDPSRPRDVASTTYSDHRFGMPELSCQSNGV